MSLSFNPNPATRIFLADIQQVQNRTNAAAEQLSSGYKVIQASDAPDQISQLLQLEANLNSNNQISTNLSNVKAQVDSSESALSSAVQLLQEATSLGTEGANSISTASQRQTLAQQIQNIQSQLVGIANTTVNGKYVFSGDDPSSPSYQLDSTSPTGVDSLTTTQSTQQIEDTSGNSYGISLTAQTIFDNRNADGTVAANNVFSAVNSLQVALTNNDTAGIATALASLQTSSAYLDQQQAFYGTVQDQVAASTTAAQNQNVSLTAQIGSIRDANIADAATALTAGQTAETAAYSAEAKLSSKSIFDYLG